MLPERDALLRSRCCCCCAACSTPGTSSYYPLPFVFALLAWEMQPPLPAPPVLALSSTVLDAGSAASGCPQHGASADAQAAFFLAWSLPLAAALGLWLFAPSRLSVHPRRADDAPRRAKPLALARLGR